MKQSKLKMAWNICHTEDYIAVTRCFKCSPYNHHVRDCRSEESCPMCAGQNKMKDFKATLHEQRCINCTTYNKYNQNKKVSEAQSALDRKCPSMKAMIEEYRQNIVYRNVNGNIQKRQEYKQKSNNDKNHAIKHAVQKNSY